MFSVILNPNIIAHYCVLLTFQNTGREEAGLPYKTLSFFSFRTMETCLLGTSYVKHLTIRRELLTSNQGCLLFFLPCSLSFALCLLLSVFCFCTFLTQSWQWQYKIASMTPFYRWGHWSVGRALLPPEALEETLSIPCRLHLLEVARIPWLEATSLQCSKVTSAPPLLCVSKVTLPLLGLPRTIQDEFLISKSLTWSHRQGPFFQTRWHSYVPEIWHGYFFRDHFSALHTGSGSHSRTRCSHSM